MEDTIDIFLEKKYGRVWVIIDEISKYKKEAKLRWRLNKSNWGLNKNIIESNHAKIRIKSNNNIEHIFFDTLKLLESIKN